MKELFFHYIPYGVVDVLLALLIIAQIANDRFDLILSNLPLLILGIVSLNRKLRSESHELDP